MMDFSPDSLRNLLFISRKRAVKDELRKMSEFERVRLIKEVLQELRDEVAKGDDK